MTGWTASFAAARRRTLMIVAPSLYEAHRAALAHGLDPARMGPVRVVTRACALRGTTPGTPFITHNRDAWPGTERGFALDEAVTALQRLGRLRPAGADDIEAAREGESA